MDIRHINSVNELIALRNFLGRYSLNKGRITLIDSDTKEAYNIGGQKWGGGSGTTQYDKDYVVGRFLQETLDKEIMFKVIDIMKEGADKIDKYLAQLGVKTEVKP